MRIIERRGIVLKPARHSLVSNLADAVLGAFRHGSRWGHPRGRDFFSLTRQIRSSPDVLVCRLVGGKITYVHRRLWPALTRIAPTLGASRLASVRETHTRAGTHRVDRVAFRRWIPAEIRRKAARLTTVEAREQIGNSLVDTLRRPDT